jgi:hypothetical protein
MYKEAAHKLETLKGAKEVSMNSLASKAEKQC